MERLRHCVLGNIESDSFKENLEETIKECLSIVDSFEKSYILGKFLIFCRKNNYDISDVLLHLSNGGLVNVDVRSYFISSKKDFQEERDLTFKFLNFWQLLYYIEKLDDYYIEKLDDYYIESYPHYNAEIIDIEIVN
ncbi:hypothetical protein [Candidatus Absconditicoccus praedator]|uniref:hypothetical protein n=1 Tax=Candidatus Absconditicoccus praedator TaxID=2735562 RepID=UPI001E5E77A3|nr:hypothetical protein [Candidatus Absconditicoccus praedator]UFX82930.1 hypothetical protein HLG78_02240 [Candidatus Absconditicoccus praedator]